MKRDFEPIRRTLEPVEASDRGMLVVDLEGYTDDVTAYHVASCVEASFVRRQSSGIPDTNKPVITRLTCEAHTSLDKPRQDGGITSIADSTP